MTQLDQEDLEDDLDLEQDVDTTKEDREDELETLRAENEALRRSKEKLLDKKHKAIQRKSTADDWVDARFDARFEERYQKRKVMERFESDNPGMEYDVANAIAQAKGVDISEAIHYIKQGWNYRIWQDKIPEAQNTQSEHEELKAKIAKWLRYWSL